MRATHYVLADGARTPVVALTDDGRVTRRRDPRGAALYCVLADGSVSEEQTYEVRGDGAILEHGRQVSAALEPAAPPRPSGASGPSVPETERRERGLGVKVSTRIPPATADAIRALATAAGVAPTAWMRTALVDAVLVAEHAARVARTKS